MSHPRSRQERRVIRSLYISRRKFIRQHIWYRTDEPVHEGSSSWRSYLRELEYYLRELKHPMFDMEYDIPTPIPEQPFDEWGRYAKFNLKCTCRHCSRRKQWRRDSDKKSARLIIIRTKDELHEYQVVGLDQAS
jgi:hypothetical protein